MPKNVEGILVLLTFVFLVIWRALFVRRKKIVRETSDLLKKLTKVNDKFEFNYNIQQRFEFKESLKSKAQFERYELINLFDKSVLNHKELLEASKKIIENRTLYADYLKKIDRLKSKATPEEVKKLGVTYKHYIKIEEKLFKEQQERPILDGTIICIVSYTSPKGRNHYSKKATYKIEKVPERYEILQKRIAMQNSEEMRRKRERSKLTQKVRIDILRRDGYRCQLCGRTIDDGIKLEVDHIIPVAKGGKSIPSNLRTLCQDCNRGKGDRLF